jgi:hypothetical protein
MMMEPIEFQEEEFRKSSYSSPSGDCVEVAMQRVAVGVRDSKNRELPALVFSAQEWEAFIRGVKSGEFEFH